MGYKGNYPIVTPVSLGLSSKIAGLTYANNAGDATNDIDIAAGSATDSLNGDVLTLGATITKRLDAAWAVGTNQGGLDTGSIGNSDYYIHLIKRPDTCVVDALFSLSHSAPTMPSNYTLRRLIGWFKRVGGTIVAFATAETTGGGIEHLWTSPTTDINLSSTLTTARRTDAVKVPLNFSVHALLNVWLSDATTSFATWLYCPDQTDLAPTTSATAPGANVFCSSAVGHAQAQVEVRTSATGTIAARASLATVDSYAAVTLGYRWSRRSPL